MSLIKIEGVASTSAPTKAQKDAAVYLFGSKGHSIVAVLDKFSRAKELRTAHLDGLLKLMKEGDDDDIIKFGASALGKKTIQNAKAFAVAKTLTASIKALKLIRVPVKWVEGHSDAAAARAQETKEIRARKTAGNKVEKPIKLDNPGAPEAETVDKKVIDAKKGSATPATDDVSVIDRVVPNPAIKHTSIIIRRLFKGNESTSSLMFRKGVGSQSTLLGLGSHGDGHVYGAGLLNAAFKATGIKPKWYLADAGDAAFDLGSAANVAKVYKWLVARKPGETFAANAKLPKSGKVPEGATRIVRADLGKSKPATKAETAKMTFDFVRSKKAGGGAIELQFKQPGNGHEWSLTISRQKDFIASDHEGSSGYQTAESFLQRGVIATGGTIVSQHQQPNSAYFQFANEAQAKEFMAWLKKQKAQTVNFKTEPKITTAPAAPAKEAYTPSGKSDVTLVDELAEVTARKIAAKPLQAREEYFNALRNTLHSNLRNSVVNTTSDGVTVALGSKLYTIRLSDNAWTIQTGVTGKPKKVGATFDIVDLLGMMDKSILRPKPNAAKPASVAAPKAAEPVKSKTSVRKTDAQKWSERGLSPDIARLIPNQERRRDSFYLALANIATSHPDFDMSRVNIYEPGSLLSIATPIGDWRLIRGDKGWPELQLSERGRSPTVEVPTWDSAKTRYVNIFDSIEKGVYDTGAKLERVLDGMVTSKTMFSNERAPYRVNYDPADQNNYDLTLINMTPEDYRRSDSKTSRDFAYNYIQYTIQYKIGHENWVEFDDHDGKPKWNIEYGDKKFVLKAHGTKAWELVRTDKKASVPVDLGAFIDPNKVAKLVMQ